MPSSPRPCPAGQLSGAASLVKVLELVPDPRARRGIRYGLPGIVAVALAAVVAGARSFAAIGQWAGELTGAQLAELGLLRGVAPDASTFRKVLARLDAVCPGQLAGAFIWTRTRVAGGRRVIAIDGKTVRGARTATPPAPHLVSASGHATGTVLGQLATAAKSNEIPAVRTLLGGLDLANVVVTVDAMHTQADTATAITGAHGDVTRPPRTGGPGSSSPATPSCAWPAPSPPTCACPGNGPHHQPGSPRPGSAADSGTSARPCPAQPVH